MSLPWLPCDVWVRSSHPAACRRVRGAKWIGAKTGIEIRQPAADQILAEVSFGLVPHSKFARALAGRPFQRATGEDVQVEVRDGFSPVPAVVDDDPESVPGEALLFRDDPDPGEEMAEEILVRRIGFPDAYDQFPRDEEEMHGSLRGDVAEAEAEVVLVDDIARDFTIGDLLEDGFLGHGLSESERGGQGEGKVGRKCQPGKRLVLIRAIPSRFSVAC